MSRGCASATRIDPVSYANQPPRLSSFSRAELPSLTGGALFPVYFVVKIPSHLNMRGALPIKENSFHAEIV